MRRKGEIMKAENRLWKAAMVYIGIVVMTAILILAIRGNRFYYASEEGTTSSTEATAATTTTTTTDTTAATTTTTTAAATTAAATTEPLQKVKTLRWQARLNSDFKVIINGEKIVLKKGKLVVVTDRKFSGTGQKSTMLVGDTEVKISNSKLSYIKDLCSTRAEGDYNTYSKEYFVNTERGFKSRTKYLVWISLDKQRVNVFTHDSNDEPWKLVQAYPCSTGKAETPTTPHFNADVSFKKYKYKYYKNNGYLYYFVEVSGSGMHKWIGGGMGSMIGRKTASHGCIRLKEKDARWVYDNVPVRTRVVVW